MPFDFRKHNTRLVSYLMAGGGTEDKKKKKKKKRRWLPLYRRTTGCCKAAQALGHWQVSAPGKKRMPRRRPHWSGFSVGTACSPRCERWWSRCPSDLHVPCSLEHRPHPDHTPALSKEKEDLNCRFTYVIRSTPFPALQPCLDWWEVPTGIFLWFQRWEGEGAVGRVRLTKR